MKYLIIILLFSANLAASQTKYNESNGASGQINAISNEKNVIINLHGGILQAAEIIKGDENSYWVKKGQFINRNNTVTVDFIDKLYVNDIPIIRQIDSKYGYLVFFSETYDYAVIYIVDENGNLNSDELILNLK